MASTELNIGLPNKNRPSSRVLKPPGGGNSNFFDEPEVKVNPPRPKYDQQNSSNLNFVMNTVDPNEAVQKARTEIEKSKQISDNEKEKSENNIQQQKSNGENNKGDEQQNTTQGRVRVPPGGFSSGLW